MLKQVEKKKPKTIEVTETASDPIVCSACNYVRRPTDTNPDWECPGCGVAYNKLNRNPEEVSLSQQELREKNREYLRKKKEASREQTGENIEETVVTTSLAIGASTFLKGLGKAASHCVKIAVPANPWLQGIGALIVVATLIYAAIRYLN